MGLPRFELLSGTVDGVNNVFYTSVAYTAGSVAVYQNGQLILNPVPEWTETNPVTGEITIDPTCTPKTGDILAAFFLDTTDAYTGEVVEEIIGSITGEEALSGAVSAGALSAYVVAYDGASGIITDTDEIVGTVLASGTISGIIEVC